MALIKEHTKASLSPPLPVFKARTIGVNVNETLFVYSKAVNVSKPFEIFHQFQIRRDSKFVIQILLIFFSSYIFNKICCCLDAVKFLVPGEWDTLDLLITIFPAQR